MILYKGFPGPVRGRVVPGIGSGRPDGQWGRKSECWDSAVAASLFATIKRELIATQAWPTRTGLRRAVFEDIEGWYNTRRLRSSLGYHSPADYGALIHHHSDRQVASSREAICLSNRIEPTPHRLSPEGKCSPEEPVVVPSGQRDVTDLSRVLKRTPSIPCTWASPNSDCFQPPKEK